MNKNVEDSCCAVDVYCGWCGPCTAMEQHLKKLKVAHITSQDRLVPIMDTIV